MPVTSWKKATTAVNETGAGVGDETTPKFTWANLGNISSDNGSYVTNSMDLADFSSASLLCSGFGFTTSDIPDGSEIQGIDIRFERKISSGAGDIYVSALLIWNVSDTTTGGVEEFVFVGTGSSWTGSDVIETHSFPTVLDGHTLETNDSFFKSVDFGVALIIYCITANNTTAAIDYVEARVYYTAPNTGGFFIAM